MYNVGASKILRLDGGFNGSCASKRLNINELFPKLRLLLPPPPRVPFSLPFLSSAVLCFLNPKQMSAPCSLGKCCKYNGLKHLIALGDNESLVIRAPLDVTQVHGWSPAAAPAPGSASREWPVPQGGVLSPPQGRGWRRPSQCWFGSHFGEP